MAKYPAPGRVKTRLAASLGEDAAVALARAFVLDLAARLATLPYEVVWAVDPADAPFAALVGGARCVPQRGADLGARMARAVADELGAGAGAVLVLGADAPHVALPAIIDAAGALAAGADVVLGPAADGGYWLIGLAAALPALFAGVAWGTARVLAETEARAAALGLSVRRVASTFDVDDVAGLARLADLVRRGAVELAHTRGVLETLTVLPT
ncbi:MAG TPA: TIGR04282 family arsenosugar biosynthesis glycosyltransferase [Candidatus Binatia bacterium]|jgi:hypothetical protein|nr:TIGR04282 family arsenosugar biosynthesis glycosyltransferase [Candidatus Binatia bacterium]